MAKILLIEDDELIGDMVRWNLSEAGYDVCWVANSQSLAEAGPIDRYDLVLLDVMLPDLNGIEVLRALRQSGANVPTLLLTAIRESARKVDGLDAGADDYLCKPFDVPELLARVRALLRRSRNMPVATNL